MNEPVPFYKRKGMGVLLFIVIFSLVTAVHMIPHLKKRGETEGKIVLKEFSSDFTVTSGGRELYNRDMARSDRFIAYARYATLDAGVYRLIFSLTSESVLGGDYQFQVAGDRGRMIHDRRDVTLGRLPGRVSMEVVLRQGGEIEPRVRFVSGNSHVRLQYVEVRLLKRLIPWKRILFPSYILAILLYMMIWVFYLVLTDNRRWKTALAIFLCCLGAVLIIRSAWISEDAYITLRHVDNFLSGHGPVFNPGERVEGFSHVLWFAVITLFRGLGFSPNGALLLPGFLFAFAALYLIFFKIDFYQSAKNRPQLHPGAAILLGMSAFIDFSTSGLETALSFFLLALYALFISRWYFRQRPLLMGLVVALLTLNRPDFGVFLVLLLAIYTALAIGRKIPWRTLVRFLTYPLILVGGYEIFRLGYFGAIFPNPYYAKSGAGSHLIQGLRYLWDLCQGSLVLGVVVIAGLVVFLVRHNEDGSRNRRLLIMGSGLLHGVLVIRGGGDFMHGRFLLPALVLVTVSTIGAFDRLVGERRLRKLIAVSVILILFLASFLVVPVQKRGGNPFKANHGITDERNFYYQGRLVPVANLFKDHMIIMWKTIGLNYKQLAQQTRTKLRVAFPTVGFLGFFSGPHVYIVDRLGLTDAVVSRVKMEKRGRPGHEKHAPFGYLMMQGLTFGDTPFELWNRAAKTPYGVLWDLTARTMSKFSTFIDKSFKERLDSAIDQFLKNLHQNELDQHADFLFFLKTFWYNHAPAQSQRLFDGLYQRSNIAAHSPAYQWIEENGEMVKQLQRRIRGPLSFGRFWSNLVFALSSSRSLQFSR